MIINSLNLSRLGFGLYNGEETDQYDEKLLEVMCHALRNDINHFDCAPCYRNLRSEKILGKLLKIHSEKNIYVSTKGGFIPFDFSKGYDAENEYVKSLFKSGLVNPEEFDQEYFQSFDTNYLEYQLEKTLTNLNKSHVDIYYIHNPEYLLYKKGSEAFLLTMNAVINWIAKMISLNKIKAFGIATWNGFYESRRGLSLQLEQFIDIAKYQSVIDYFKYVQAPYNISQISGIFSRTQTISGEKMSLFRAADLSDISLISSAPLNQGKLVNYSYSKNIKSKYKHLNSAEFSLKYVLSTPGINSTLISTSSINHLMELISLSNLKNNDASLFLEILNSN
jgi:aryl-alcohol dehydrogenase-like predicted oxidoreductase